MMALCFIGKSPGPRASEMLVTRCNALAKHTQVPKQRRFTSTLQHVAASHSVPAASLPPLSALPTRVLLRSLLVATVSSKPLLLQSSLWLMSILSKQKSGFLLNVDRNPILHAILKKTFYEQFCAGENGLETKATIRELKDMGFRGVIMTYAKETVFDHRTNSQQGLGVAVLESQKNGELVDPKLVRCANIETWRKGTVETVEQLEDGDYLAVK